ncbi:MAG: molecular chaperone DnaJ [Agathobacter sp.]|nr:molecular chaperone DnaJ [Agathobacter sp.]
MVGYRGKDCIMTLSEEREQLNEQKRMLDLEKKEFFRKVEIEDRRLEQQKSLFEMKFQILEAELVKLAAEREEIEKKKAFYDRVEEFHARSYATLPDQQVGELFFRGVASQQSLKKRYKDLIKIYHPDNVDGDNSLVIEINKEYDHLSQVLAL